MVLLNGDSVSSLHLFEDCVVKVVVDLFFLLVTCTEGRLVLLLSGCLMERLVLDHHLLHFYFLLA